MTDNQPASFFAHLFQSNFIGSQDLVALAGTRLEDSNEQVLGADVRVAPLGRLLVGRLNDLVLNETQDYLPVTVSMPFEPSLLRGSANVIEITSGSNTNGTNHDDFEFYDLKIVLYSDRQMLIAIPEEAQFGV